MRKLITSLVIILAVNLSYSQTKLAEITFENPGGYSTGITEFTDYIPPNAGGDGRDYFHRTDGSNMKSGGNGINFTNIQGSYYFAAQDIDAEGATIPTFLLIDNINISGYSSIELRVHLAEDDQTTNGGARTQHWDNNASGTNNDYVHFNYDIDNTGGYTNLLWVEASGNGSHFEPSIDTDFNGTGDGTAITETFTQFIQNITGTGDLLDIRIEFNLNGNHEDIAIDNIEIWGTLIPCATTTTWNGAVWSAGTPDLTTEAILDANYSTAANGNFSACNLTVNGGSRLTVDNGGYVEVQNDLVVDGELFVETSGAFVQNNDFGTVTENGTIRVIKTTSDLNAWYEYTYWSSPVTGETVGDALTDSDTNRRFIFNGNNFLDATMENGNNNATVAGQDDIDDNGDDWTLVAGTDTMTPGVGYAATHSEIAFVGPPFTTPPYQFDYIFEGTFNNGSITVPVYRNDSETNDNNWNFIGNPYPSAIDADIFLSVNSNIATNVVVDGAIFLWSQNTAPEDNANGNQNLNFAGSDYAVINAIGETAGGDGITPSRFIPSGQGFFVSYSDAATPISTTGDISQGEVIFNNTMRATGDNNLFFRSAKSSKTTSITNKIWFNLTSDNGVFNQVLVAYASGATSNNDGMAYDTPKNLSTDAPAILYTTIQGDSKKFAIQGKAPGDLNIDEVIGLGIKTAIDVSTVYTLSIHQTEGDFLNANTVYLKDNLTGTIHNLKDNDYNFSSASGEYNDRFEIVFNSEILSVDETLVRDNDLMIIEHKNGDVQFKLNATNTAMTTIEIIDLQGRSLNTFKLNGNDQTFKLSNLSQAPYFAKVELSNGYTIVKKAIKQY